jgi:hypothetical protein
MNVRYRVELSQAERDELSAMLSGGTHAARKSSGPRFCWRPMPVLRGREGESFMTLGRKAARWAADNVEALKAARPLVPGGLNDRAADN